MENVRNIAMKFNKEQFNAIEPKLKKSGIELNVWDIGTENCYLTNNWDYRFCIGNHSQNHSSFKRCDTYEQWNEKVFLEACGIFEEPKFEITKEQILELENGFTLPKLKEWFPEVFETVLEDNKWYVRKSNSKCIIFNQGNENQVGYGFGYNGNWDNGWALNSENKKDFRLATTEEVTEALKNEAVKRGIHNGYFESIHGIYNIQYHKLQNPYHYADKSNILYYKGRAVYSKGQWAKIIPTKTIQEAEELLKELGHNFKIV